MLIGVPLETEAGEALVAAAPATAKKLEAQRARANHKMMLAHCAQ